MFNIHLLSTLIIVNIFMLVFSSFNLFKRKHIVNLLLALCLWSIVILEISKFSLLLNFHATDKILGLGFCLVILFWLIGSISLLPSRSYSLSRVILTPLFGLLALVFFLIWLIKPFIAFDTLSTGMEISNLARYFFVLVVFGFSLSLSNLERSFYYLKQKRVRLFLFSALFFLAPYILLATHAVLFSKINITIFMHSSFSILIGGLLFLASSKDGFSVEAVKEETAVHTSLILFLVGGYLFFVGIFIKLFQVFGWNLNTLFSFLTTAFILFALFFLVFSSSFKERFKNILFRHLTRQRYDWQQIWEDFTYRISLVTDIEKIKKNIQDAISKIMNVKTVKVFVFEQDSPFEGAFCDWLLREGNAFNTREVFATNGLADKFPKADTFFKENKIEVACPLYGDKKIIGLISLSINGNKFLDQELLKVLTLQASSVILNCWANQALREAEKKESIYKMSSFVIHDVKNYVNNLSLLIANRNKFSKPEFQDDAFFTLENTMRKMKGLIAEFTALRGDLSLKMQQQGLAKIVNEAIADLGKERFKDIDLNINIEPGVNVYIDAHFLNKVLVNMIINALEAMKNKGKLSIESSTDSDFVRLIIKDSGKGMSKDFIDNYLFKAFSSTKEKGIGVGLYQCKTIIEAHGGTIEAESLEGEGTTFTIKLPLAEVTKTPRHQSPVGERKKQ